jgi:acyl carrier protein
MTKDEIRQLIITELAGVAPEADAATLAPNDNVRETLDIDSYDFLRFLIGLSEKLGFEVPEKDYAKLTTIDDMTQYLVAHAPQTS